MDGKNCTGRKISLLNDSGDGETTSVPTKIQLPPLTAHSRTSSCSSTPSLSPQTPHLTRSSSSDSRVFASPSPLTPSFNSFDPNQQNQRQHQQYYIPHPHHAKMDDQSASMYPPIPDASGALNPIYHMPPQQVHNLPMVQPHLQQQIRIQPAQPQQQQHQPPPQQQQQQQQQASLQRSSTSPRSEPSRASNASATSNSKQPQQKKNQYPCPMAKQVGCNDFFTTSGHAARHAKKHTGKKDAFCPECNKAFTRKDNMEQHRRTHQNGRGTARSTDDKVKKNTKQQAKKIPMAKSEAQLEAAVEQQLAEQSLTQDPVVMAMHQTQPPPQMPLQSTLAPPLPQPIAEQAMMMPTSTPYFLNSIIDQGPVPALPLVPDHAMRPPLQRANFTTSLEYIPPIAPALLGADDLHYSYPSPGLSNGLNSLALAASEHRRMSEEKARSDSSQSPSNETPEKETP